jgi:tetratricopeptide (TPR) repeat protein
MFSIIMKRIAGLAACALFLSVAAMAQTGPIEGTVKVKNADGSLKPVPDAIVDIYRLDIKGQWEVKADKSGHYIRLGMPIVGRYIVVASAPGIEPTWVNNVRLTQVEKVDIVANPGDGTRLTFDQVKAQISGGGQAQPQVSPSDRAKIEEARKEQEAHKKQMEELQANFDQARTHYNQGVVAKNEADALKTFNEQIDKYKSAQSEFEEASKIDPSRHKDFLELAYKSNASLAETHYQIGVLLFNNKQKDEAKPHFEKAMEAALRAVEIAANSTNANLTNDLITYYNIYAKNASLLVEFFGAADKVDPAIAVFTKAEALDATNKTKWGVLKADMYRNAGRTDEAVAAYNAVLAADPANVDALYGLGLTLIASTDLKVIQEGANKLGEFVSKAKPEDKRVASVKEALEAVKNAYKIEAEKPTPAKRRGKP